MLARENDIIAAVATPPGRGGVGIIRISGKSLSHLLPLFGKEKISPRTAVYTDFTDADDNLIDQGLLLFFPAPHSFTGEDVIEIQGHGGPVVMDTLLERVLQLGARLAQPGEFSQRAFLNDKIDLAQAEAIADLIDASSRQAARSAMRSLQGAFSERIHHVVELLVQLRVYVEAAIDFPEEEIDFLGDSHVNLQLRSVIGELRKLMAGARQGVLLGEGMKVVLAGEPNAGKSSLLNALIGSNAAIVTDIAGTTRDVLRESVNIDGMPLHFVDTAGLRESTDVVEQEGIRRAWEEIENADRVLFIVDVTKVVDFDLASLWPAYSDHFCGMTNLTLVLNKIDCLDAAPVTDGLELPAFCISAKNGLGLGELKEHLKQCMGFHQMEEGNFIARRRHLNCLDQALVTLEAGFEQLELHHAGELLAEDLRTAQRLLGEITGEFTADDLLGEIFSSFCIGK
jgi:tRNA modification GTPase